MIWQAESINYEALDAGGVLVMDRLIEFAMAQKVRRITLAALLHAILAAETAEALERAGFSEPFSNLLRTVNHSLRQATLDQLREALWRMASARVTANENDYFRQQCWTTAAIEALHAAEEKLSEVPLGFVALASVTVQAYVSMDETAQEYGDREILQTMLDLSSLAEATENLARIDGEVVALFDAEGLPQVGALAPAAEAALRGALELAARGGASRVQLLMLLKALLDDGAGFGIQALENAVSIGQRAESVVEQLGHLMRPGAAATFKVLPLQQSSFADEAQEALRRGYVAALAQGLPYLTPKWLLIEILRTRDDLLQSVLGGTLKIDVQALVRSAESLVEGGRRALPLPVELCSCREIMPSVQTALQREKIENQVLRALFNKQRPSVLLYGEAGVGKSTLAERVGQSVANGEASFLRDRRVVCLDLGGIPREVVAGRCASILTWMREHSACLFIVEGLGVLMEQRGEELKRALSQGELYLIGVVTGKEREAILQLLDDEDRYFVPVEVTEPDSNLTLRMLAQQAEALGSELNVRFEEGLFERARKLADDYLISRRNPLKLTNLVREAAMEVAFHSSGLQALVTRNDVAVQVARLTGLPSETILGTGEDKDFEAILGRGVMGQAMALRKVAQRLDMIQKGLVDKKRPPAIFMFVGLSGTGKTELAKAIAQVYSSTHTLITYAMENFKESHNVSGLIGTSQGYVGYEEGGKLINDLNRDPYATVLFDEVEKAHPAIWDPFLHLFDEGSVTDMRGVTAYGNKSFFIMTSNIGYEKLCRMLRAGNSEEEIEAALMEDIYAATHKGSGEKCFRPEFIGRITRGGGIIIFNPLSLEALQGIAGHLAAKTQREWNETRDVQLVIESEVARHLGERVYAQNEADLSSVYGGRGGTVQYKGGRVVTTLFDTEVNGRLASAMRGMVGASQVRVVLEDSQIKLRVLGAQEAIAEQKTRRDLLEDRLTKLSGITGYTEAAILNLDANAVESLLGALETVSRLMQIGASSP